MASIQAARASARAYNTIRARAGKARAQAAELDKAAELQLQEVKDLAPQGAEVVITESGDVEINCAAAVSADLLKAVRDRAAAEQTDGWAAVGAMSDAELGALIGNATTARGAEYKARMQAEKLQAELEAQARAAA